MPPPKAGVSSQRDSTSLSVFGGVVWGARNSQDYEGPFITVSAGYKKLPGKVQKVVDEALRRVGTSVLRGIAKHDVGMTEWERWKLKERIQEFQRQIASNSSNELLVNISLGRGGVGSVTVSYDFTFSANRKRSWAVQGSWYLQLLPWGENVPFR